MSKAANPWVLRACAILIAGSPMSRCTAAQTAPTPFVQGYVDTWSSVLALHPLAPVVIVTRTVHRCEFARADETSVTCVRRLRGPYGETAVPMTFDRRLVQELALDVAPQATRPRGEAVGTAAGAGGFLGLLVGAHVGRDGQSAARGAVAGGTAGAILAGLATRHREQLVTVYQVP